MTRTREYRGRFMLGTYVTGMEYNFQSHTARLYLDKGCCCDIEDCVDFFQRIDPDVQIIRTFTLLQEDTCYRRDARGQTWGALKPHRPDTRPAPSQQKP